MFLSADSQINLGDITIKFSVVLRNDNFHAGKVVQENCLVGTLLRPGIDRFR